MQLLCREGYCTSSVGASFARDRRLRFGDRSYSAEAATGRLILQREIHLDNAKRFISHCAEIMELL